MRTEAYVFVGVGAYLVASAVIYGVLSGEPAGTTMLALGGALGLFIGGYLIRVSPARAVAAEPPGVEPYLPHSSIWPFAMGLGALLVGHGLSLGLWALLPGLLLLGSAILGFARQSRHRNGPA